MTYNAEYHELVLQWQIEKKSEQQANARRLNIEKQILEYVRYNLKESGTNNFPGNLKILTGIIATCDKNGVTNLYQKFINNELNVPEFPFRHKWEPEVKMLNKIREDDSFLYNKHFSNVITFKLKKPAFEVKKESK